MNYIKEENDTITEPDNCLNLSQMAVLNLTHKEKLPEKIQGYTWNFKRSEAKSCINSKLTLIQNNKKND